MRTKGLQSRILIGVLCSLFAFASIAKAQSIGYGNANPPKLDDQAVNGLLGTEDSLAYKVEEIERHHHSYDHWFGLASAPSGETHRADHMVMTPFVMDAGNDTWGTWLQILGSSDTPHVGTAAKFDVRHIYISDVETDTKKTLIQIGYGTSGAAALAADQITELFCTPAKNAKQDPYEIRGLRQDSGTKVWARCWVDGQATSTVDFHFSLHEYEG